MITSDLSGKEIAAFIGVSTDTIRRAVRKGEIPAIREKTALRFDLQEVLTCIQLKAEAKFFRHARREPTAHRAKRPPLGNTGALPTGIVTGRLRIR